MAVDVSNPQSGVDANNDISAGTNPSLLNSNNDDNDTNKADKEASHENALEKISQLTKQNKGMEAKLREAEKKAREAENKAKQLETQNLSVEEQIKYQLAEAEKATRKANVERSQGAIFNQSIRCKANSELSEDIDELSRLFNIESYDSATGAGVLLKQIIDKAYDAGVAAEKNVKVQHYPALQGTNENPQNKSSDMTTRGKELAQQEAAKRFGKPKDK